MFEFLFFDLCFFFLSLLDLDFDLLLDSPSSSSLEDSVDELEELVSEDLRLERCISQGLTSVLQFTLTIRDNTFLVLFQTMLLSRSWVHQFQLYPISKT